MRFNKNTIIKRLNRQPYFYLIKNFEKKPELLKDKILQFSKNFKKIRKQNQKGHLILEIKPNEKKIKFFKKKKKNKIRIEVPSNQSRWVNPFRWTSTRSTT